MRRAKIHWLFSFIACNSLIFTTNNLRQINRTSEGVFILPHSKTELILLYAMFINVRYSVRCEQLPRICVQVMKTEGCCWSVCAKKVFVLLDQSLWTNEKSTQVYIRENISRYFFWRKHLPRATASGPSEGEEKEFISRGDMLLGWLG